MLRYLEPFDHITVDESSNGTAMLTALGYTLIQKGNIVGYLAQDQIPLFRTVAAEGRHGTPALCVGQGSRFCLPYVSRDCTRLVVGISVAPYLRNANAPWVAGGGIIFSFRYNLDVNFTIECRYTTRRSLTVTMKTGLDGVGYPAITTSENIPTPNMMNDYTYIELSVDVANYTSGTAKVAANGITYINKTGIVTAAYNSFGDNPADPRSKLNNIYMEFLSTQSYWGDKMGGYTVDSLYLADDAGGQLNSILGSFFVKSLFPIADGLKHNWTPYENSTVMEDGVNYSRVDDDPLLNGDETTYIEADQDLVDGLLLFDMLDMPVESGPIAVNHRTAFRNVASQGNPPPNTIVPLYQSGGDAVIVENPSTKKVSGWSYAFLDVYYGVQPGPAIPWTRSLLEGSQFGYLMREQGVLKVGIDEIGFADEAIDELNL